MSYFDPMKTVYTAIVLLLGILLGISVGPVIKTYGLLYGIGIEALCYLLLIVLIGLSGRCHD
jgi:hypothetical protein